MVYECRSVYPKKGLNFSLIPTMIHPREKQPTPTGNNGGLRDQLGVWVPPDVVLELHADCIRALRYLQRSRRPGRFVEQITLPCQ